MVKKTVDPISLLTHFRVLHKCATHDNVEMRENCASYVPVLDEEITEEEVFMAIPNMKKQHCVCMVMMEYHQEFINN